MSVPPTCSHILPSFFLPSVFYDYRAVLSCVENENDQRMAVVGLHIIEDLDIGNRIQIFCEYG